MKLFYLPLLLVGTLFFANEYLDMRRSDLAFAELLSDNPFHYQANIDYYYVKGRPMRYVELGNDSLPLIVFIHGAPSSSAFWEDML